MSLNADTVGQGRDGPKPVAILHLEDSPLDAELVDSRLRRGGLHYSIERAVTREDFVAALERGRFDLILSDYNLPQFDGYAALAIAQERWPDVPFIFVSGVLGEEVAIETLKGGAVDYVLKQRIDRLVPAVRRALAEAAERVARRDAEQRLRDSEERFRSLVSVITDIPWTTNADGQFVTEQPAWTTYTGQSWEQLCGYGWLDAVHPDDRDRLFTSWQQACTGRTLYEAQGRLCHAPSQQYRHFFVRATPVFDSDGHVREWVGSCTDIHDRKQAEHERERLLENERTARAEAERANGIKDDFLATVSHELRTPLNAILGWSQIIAREGLDVEDAQEGLDAINRNARAQSQIIDELLDMSRIMSGKVQLNARPVELLTIVEEAVQSVTPSADVRQIRLVKTLTADGSPIVGDADRLRQVVWNLLGNAIKFTPRGGRIDVSLQRTDSHLQLRISDTGEGISPQLLPHIFDRFRQGDGSTTRRYGGLGLGLSIVKQLVELHGGSVEANSKGAGKGATFIVRLPLSPASVRDSSVPVRHVATSPAPAGAPECDAVRLSGIKILIVDDEADARKLIERMLSHCEASVVSAATVADALEMIAAERPHMLVSDIGMPREDGYDLIRKVRRLPSDAGGQMPAIALTAFARGEDRQKALKAGYQMHLTKPVDRTKLLAAIARLCDQVPSDARGG
ncbi:MAG TPA: response regulator [Tepidisphaeraceae bacterium]|jgi:PAS domain S-box-containing protein